MNLSDVPHDIALHADLYGMADVNLNAILVHVSV